MELRYENLKDKPETFLAFTGLYVEEFQILLKTFTVAWECYVQQNSLPPRGPPARLWRWSESPIGNMRE
jgi:hypothetical protein